MRGRQRSGGQEPTARRGRRWVWATAVGTVVTAGVAGALLVHTRPLFFDDFAGTGLVTNEFAYHNPKDPRSVTSPRWVVTSGSFFRDHGTGWTGPLDSRAPDPSSSEGTNSDVFRAVTRPSFGDVKVSLRFRVDAMAPHAGADWTGIHLFLRYRDPFTLYVVSLVRQDGRVEVKKKLAGGASNGGTYYSLTGTSAAVPLGTWHAAEVSVQDRAGGVDIVVSIDGREVTRVRDSGVGGPPLTGSGKVGLRGDFTQFHVQDFRVSAT